MYAKSGAIKLVGKLLVKMSENVLKKINSSSGNQCLLKRKEISVKMTSLGT